MRILYRLTITLLLFALAGALFASFVLMPHSLRIHMASLATCDDAWNAEEHVDGTKFWERPLSRIYRLKYSLHGGPTQISDFLVDDLTVFHVLVEASRFSEGNCDTDIQKLFQRYADDSRDIDRYDDLGYTALHTAIILQLPQMVQVLLGAGANVSLETTRTDESSDGKSAVELAVQFHEQHDDARSRKIRDMVVDASGLQ